MRFQLELIPPLIVGLGLFSVALGVFLFLFSGLVVLFFHFQKSIETAGYFFMKISGIYIVGGIAMTLIFCLILEKFRIKTYVPGEDHGE